MTEGAGAPAGPAALADRVLIKPCPRLLVTVGPRRSHSHRPQVTSDLVARALLSFASRIPLEERAGDNRFSVCDRCVRSPQGRSFWPAFLQRRRLLMTDTHDAAVSGSVAFSTATEGLRECSPPEVVELADGDAVELEIGAVSKRLEDATVRMLAYNGSIPGPTLKVRQGSRVVVNVTNNGDHDDTVHWHGLRLANRYDGTHETQAPIPVGGSFSYELEFPDPGVYWYHPHIREDYGQELGLYGNILVVPAEPDYWPPVNRELLLTLDDILIEDGKVAPFSRSETTYVAMGRFGNVLLIGGEAGLSLTANLGEVVRLYLTNTANTRVFNVGIEGARMKLVGADSGRYEHEEFVERVVLAPSERAVIDVIFDQSGQVTLEHHTPQQTYTLAAITVSDERAMPSLDEQFEIMRSERRTWWRSETGLRPTSTPRRTRRWRSSPRWTWASLKAPSSTAARCIQRSSAPRKGAAPSAG